MKKNKPDLNVNEKLVKMSKFFADADLKGQPIEMAPLQELKRNRMYRKKVRKMLSEALKKRRK